jgi:hypothetical protein
MTVWGYSDQIQLVRDLRLHFDSRHLESLLGEDLRRGSEADPVLLLYDDRVVECASLLARECGPEGTGVRLFGEGITTALTALLVGQTRSHTHGRPAAGLSTAQLKRVLDYFHEHLSSDVSLESVAVTHWIVSVTVCARFQSVHGCLALSLVLECPREACANAVAERNTPPR